jgi:hypothetical protein
MNFIYDIFKQKGDKEELIHLQFQKFSKGEFRDRALVDAKSSAKMYTIKTSAEFANGLVRTVAEKLGDDVTRVTGAVVSTQDLKGELNFKEIKQFQGVKRYLIDDEMSGESIIQLLDKFPRNFFALSFSAAKDNTILKVKPKAPKSGKAGKGDEKPNADFCTLKTTDKDIAKSFIFENPDFKTAKINHTYIIESLEIPEELKEEGDFAKMREGAKRKGKIIRDAIIDGEGIKTETDFEA